MRNYIGTVAGMFTFNSSKIPCIFKNYNNKI